MNTQLTDSQEYASCSTLTLECLSNSCKNKLWNYLDDLFSNGDTDMLTIACILNNILNSIGEKKLTAPAKWRDGLKTIQTYWDQDWHNALNILESFLKSVYSKSSDLEHNGNYYSSQFNSILEAECSCYRFNKYNMIKISSEEEMATINEALDTGFEPVTIALEKAITFYSSPTPDYENAIKESITAVEAMCNCIIKGGKSLGDALNELEKNGCQIHGALKEGFKKIYGYTSDEGGIRHGSETFCHAPEEDAKYMIVSCSAFVNYLKAKMVKIDTSKEDAN